MINSIIKYHKYLTVFLELKEQNHTYKTDISVI